MVSAVIVPMVEDEAEAVKVAPSNSGDILMILVREDAPPQAAQPELP